MNVSPRIKKISEILASKSIPSWRLKQVVSGLSKQESWATLPGVPKEVQQALEEGMGRQRVSTLEPVLTQEADYAKKVLFRCVEDDSKIEAVALSFHNHTSLCISSQVGCAFGCSFCATGKIGLKRHLTADEIADQVAHFMRSGVKVDSVSFMGMGEPLGNPRIFDAISCITDELGLSPRRLNVSTIGIIPGIRKLTDLHPQVNLAFSLHSPYPAEREKLMPIQKLYPFDKVLEAIDLKIAGSKRKVWLAYLLLKGVNDTPEHAKELAKIIKSRPADVNYLYHVNLLPYNEAKNVHDNFKYSESVHEFERILANKKISTSFRNSFGRSIDAACGQLFADYEAKTLKPKSLDRI